MKDFSLLYGPVRAWLPVVAMAALAMVVFVSQSGGGDDDCTPDETTAAAADCAEPLTGDRQLLDNGDGFDVAPAGLPMDGTEPQDDAEPSAWDTFDPLDLRGPLRLAPALAGAHDRGRPEPGPLEPERQRVGSRPALTGRNSRNGSPRFT